ncbi:MAG: hypothetical protein QM756_09560 [Polyangiaceae bacterium]
MSARFLRARSSLAAVVCVVSACSLFAPTEDELSGGGASAEGGAFVSTSGGASAAKGGAASATGGAALGGTASSGAATGGTTNGGAALGGATSGGATNGGAALGGAATGGAASGGAAVAGSSASGGAPIGSGGSSGCVPDFTSSKPKASTLLDDFSDGSAGPGFFVNGSPTTCAVEASSRVVVSLPNPTPPSNYCYYQSTGSFDFTCDSLVVKVPQIARATLGLQTFVYLIPDATHKFYLVVDNGAYILGSEGGKSVGGGRYDASVPWWRLREEGSGSVRQVVFETSQDATSWVERARIARPFALNNVRIALGAGSYQNVSDPGSGMFSCLNAPAGCR